MTLYQGRHRSQYDGGPLATQNCTPSALADAADQATAGRIDLTGSEVRALLAPNEETNPVTPGWSLRDADVAANRLGIGFSHFVGSWGGLVARRAEGRGIVLQGVSAAFTTGCSGAFDGEHAVYLPPLDHSDGRWRLGDPICPTWRWEEASTLRDYAGRFAGAGKARYGYTDRIPLVPPDTATEDPMPGLHIENTARFIGEVEVIGTGRSAVQIDDKELIGLAIRSRKDAYFTGTLVPSLDEQLGNPKRPGDRSSIFVVGDIPAIVLRVDVTPHPVAMVPKAEVGKAVNAAADHIAGAVPALSAAIEEVRIRA